MNEQKLKDMPIEIWAQDVNVRWLPTWSEQPPSLEEQEEYKIRYYKYIREGVSISPAAALKPRPDPTFYASDSDYSRGHKRGQQLGWNDCMSALAKPEPLIDTIIKAARFTDDEILAMSEKEIDLLYRCAGLDSNQEAKRIQASLIAAIAVHKKGKQR